MKPAPPAFEAGSAARRIGRGRGVPARSGRGAGVGVATPAGRDLQTEAQARHVGLGRREPRYLLRGRAHGHGVGLDRKPQAALRARLHHHRAGADRHHREVHVRLAARPALAVLAIRGERERALAVARDGPQRQPLARLPAPVGVEAGAADCVVKPFSAAEPVARTGASRRRRTGPETFVIPAPVHGSVS